MDLIINPSVVKPIIDVDIASLVEDEKQTIVHVSCIDEVYGMMLIRIWPSTFLIQENGKRKKLLHTYNITPYPKYLPVGSGHIFTLVFEGLEKQCETFELLEDIPEPGGFHIRDIARNNKDVYQLQICSTD